MIKTKELRKLTALILIILLLPVCGSAQESGLWMDVKSPIASIENFLMAGSEYFGASKPEIVSVENCSYDKAMRFWGKDTESYTGCRYTGRLYHEYLMNSDRWQSGQYITFCFYARGESSCDAEPKLSVGIQTETWEHVAGAHGKNSETFALSNEWKQYTKTVAVPCEPDSSEAGYRAILNLGYYGQTTYIADFKAYIGSSSIFSAEYAVSDCNLTINEQKCDTILSGTAKLSAELGAAVVNVGLILALYDEHLALEKIAISPRRENGTVSISVPIETAVGHSLYGMIWNMDTLQPLGNTFCMTKPDTESDFDFSMTGGTAQYPLVCAIGKNAQVTRDGLPVVTLSPKQDGFYKLTCTMPNGETLPLLAEGVLKGESSVQYKLSDFLGAFAAYGDYKLQAFYRGYHRQTSEDSLYFRITKAQEYSEDAVVLNGTKLEYRKDYKGNRISDYSKAGYALGLTDPPKIPNVISISPSGADDTASIQAAIDTLAARSADENGYRGAVLLKAGVWQVSDTVKINTSGIVIRGENYTAPNLVDAQPIGTVNQYKQNAYKGGTVILATTKTPNALLFSIAGEGSIRSEKTKSADVIQRYVPNGTTTLAVNDASSFYPGQEIVVEETANNDWISAIGMDQIPQRTTVDANPTNADNQTIQWTQYVWNWNFERIVTAVNGNTITLNSPITNALDRQYGKTIVYPMKNLRIEKIGLENLHFFSLWSPNADGVDNTAHAQRLLDVENADDIYIKNITAEHFNTYCINLRTTAKRITIDTFYNLIADKSYYNGIGYEETGRTFIKTGIYVGRYGIYNAGQQLLAMHIYGINNRHLTEFSSKAAGPNVIYDSISKDYLTSTGPHMHWSVGGLYDNVIGSVALQNRLNMGSGHGWAGAWYTAWNTSGDLIVQQPPTAQNYSVGHVGLLLSGDIKGYPQGSVTTAGTRFSIESLYLYQKNQ